MLYGLFWSLFLDVSQVTGDPACSIRDTYSVEVMPELILIGRSLLRIAARRGIGQFGNVRTKRESRKLSLG